MKFDWHGLSQREQGMLVFGGVFVAIMLIYWLIIEPLESTVVQKQTLLFEKRTTLAWMKQIHQQRQGEPKGTKLTRSQLLTQVSNQLKAQAFKDFPYELQQNNQGEIQLSFKKVPYLLYLKWIKHLTTVYQVQVKRLTIEKTDTSGVVKTSAVFIWF